MNKEKELNNLKKFLALFNVDIEDIESIYDYCNHRWYHKEDSIDIDGLGYKYTIDTTIVNDKPAIEVVTILFLSEDDFINKYTDRYYFQDHELLFVASNVEEIVSVPY